jgi:anaphase-promoting complex subunit 3
VGWFKNVFGSSASIAQDVARVLPLHINGVLLEFRLGGDALRGLLDGGPINDDDHAPVEVASYRQLRVHDNSLLLTRIDDAWTGLGPFLRNAGGTQKDKAEFLYNVAKSYLGAAGDPGRARGIAQELAGIGHAAMARWVTGECLIEGKDIDGALGEWQAVLDLEPDNLDALFSLGTFYLDSNDYRRAETYLSHAARLYPDTPVVRYTRGRNLYLLGRYREAIAELEKVRDLPGGGKDQYPLIDYILGASDLEVGQVKEASTALEAYIKWATTQPLLTPLDVDAHLKLAQAYERLGKRFQAHQEREKGDALLKKIQASIQRSGGRPSPAGASLPAGAPPPAAAPSPPATAAPRTPRHGQP